MADTAAGKVEKMFGSNQERRENERHRSYNCMSALVPTGRLNTMPAMLIYVGVTLAKVLT